MDSPRPRSRALITTITTLLALSLLAACSGEGREGESIGESTRAVGSSAGAPSPAREAPGEAVELPPEAEAIAAAAAAGGAGPGDVDETEGEAASAEDEGEAEDADGGDPLAPIPPGGPAPGSPEADAELLALLDESTLTQDEFAKAFGRGGVEVEGDALVLGRPTRARPVVTITRVTGSGAAQVEALARTQLRQLEACQAMALSKEPETAGALTLRLRYAAGEVEAVEPEGGEALGDSLRECLASVAQGWAIEAASGELRVSLRLASE